MASPIFDLMNNQNMVTRFLEFKKNFKGDPQQEVQRLLNSGRMTQQQYNQLTNMANSFKQFLK